MDRNRCGRVFWYRRQRTLRGPLSLLWVGMLAVATGPATCLVVPSSTRLRGSSCFATASSPPKLVFGNNISRGLGSPRDHRGADLRQKVYAVITRGGEEAGSSAHGWRQREHQQHHEDESSAKARGKVGFGTATSLSSRKGVSNADKTLHASLPGVEFETLVSETTSPSKRVLILMSDTGGGHRASSEALSAALKKLYGDQVWYACSVFSFSSRASCT